VSTGPWEGGGQVGAPWRPEDPLSTQVIVLALCTLRVPAGASTRRGLYTRLPLVLCGLRQGRVE
jgi:hypothetical protein